MVGYIHLWRRLLKKPIWLKSTPEQRSVLIAILLMANFYENEWEWKGEKFKVEPGQFITSLESIRKKSGQGISIQNVRSSLKRFEKLEFLTNKSTKQGRLISIINWIDYQSSENSTQHSTQQRPNKEATKTQHLSNNDKKDKNERIKDIGYPEWLDLSLWKEFKKYRTKIKAPLTTHAEQLALTKLDAVRKEGFAPADIINQTIECGWKSFFPPKNKTPSKNNKDIFRDDHFLKTAYNMMKPPYKEDDFNCHCRAFNRDPGEVRHQIKQLTEGGVI